MEQWKKQYGGGGGGGVAGKNANNYKVGIYAAANEKKLLCKLTIAAGREEGREKADTVHKIENFDLHKVCSYRSSACVYTTYVILPPLSLH